MKKKLIEVALPLEAIDKASAREKSIRHGPSSMLHLWWMQWSCYIHYRLFQREPDFVTINEVHA